MGVTNSSPLHQQSCVAASTVVGAAFGALAGAGPASAVGAVAGAAVGLVIGKAMCDKPAVEKLFKDHLDFESQLKNFEANAGRWNEAIRRLASDPLIKDEQTAEVLLSHALRTALSDPKGYFPIVNEQVMTPRSSSGVAGLAPAGNLARDAYANA